MINELEKDKAALAKDIGALAAQVSLKRKELSDLDLEMRTAREALEMTKRSKDWTLSSIDSEVAKREKRNLELDSQLETMKKIKGEQVSAVEASINEKSLQLASLEKKVLEAEKRHNAELDAEERAHGRVRALHHLIESLEKEASNNKALVEKLTSLLGELMPRVESLKNAEAMMEASVSGMQQRQSDLDQYHANLKAKEELLNKKEGELNEAAQKTMFVFEKSIQISGSPIQNANRDIH